MWALRKLCYDLASNARLRERSRSYIYMYAFLALLDALAALQLTALAMVYSDYIGRHSDCDSDGLSGTELLPFDLLAYRLRIFLSSLYKDVETKIDTQVTFYHGWCGSQSKQTS